MMTARGFATLAFLICAAPIALQAQMAIKSGEQKTERTKQCYYKYAGSTYTRTVESFELCPISIDVGTDAGGTSASAGTGCGNAFSCALPGLAAGLSANSRNGDVTLPGSLILQMVTFVQQQKDLIADQRQQLSTASEELRAAREQSESQARQLKELANANNALDSAREADRSARVLFARTAACAYSLDGTLFEKARPAISPASETDLRASCKLLRARSRTAPRGYVDPSLRDVNDRIDAILRRPSPP
jgi:hypothetical protein